MTTAAAAGCAVGAAVCYAGAATLQHRAAGREPEAKTLDPRLLFRLIKNPLWIVGAVADIAGTGLHGAALVLGPLALVQPLLVSGLIIAVPFEAALDRRRPGRRDLTGVLLGAIGLASFVIVADPSPGPIVPENAPLTGVVIGVGVFMALLVVLAQRTSGRARATMLGIATGAGYALAAALAKAVLDLFVDSGAEAVFTDWHLYTLMVAGFTALILNQNAFQAGRLAGPLTGIVLTDPLVSIVIAVTAYEEQLSSGPWAVTLSVLALGIMAVGVVLVSTRRLK